MQIQERQGFELHVLHLEHFSLLLQILSGIVFVRDIVPISSPTQRNPQNPTPYSNPLTQYMTHSQMLGKFEYTRGPIFKVVLEC